MIEGFNPSEHDASINVSPRVETPQSERHTPFYIAMLDMIHQRIPEVEAGAKVALDSIDRQALDNFQVFKSRSGVEFTVSKVTITPEDVLAIAAAMPKPDRVTPPLTSNRQHHKIKKI